MSDVFSGLVNYIGNVVRGRLMSISNYLAKKEASKIESLANAVLEMIPDRINITDHLYLEGGLDRDVTVVPNDHMVLSFDASI